MQYHKTIVCLANSRKTGGRCLAGKEVLPNGNIGKWVRPISERHTQEVSEEERRYETGEDPKLFDIVEIPFKEHLPQNHQVENHLIDPEHYWSKIRTFAWSDISQLIDSPTTLWLNGFSSTSGMNNRVPEDKVTSPSLYLIHPKKLALLVGRKAPEFPDSKRAVRARFHYRDADYRMDVTDPATERDYLRQKDGEYPIESARLCVSLAERHTDGYCYKLVASILTEEHDQ